MEANQELENLNTLPRLGEALRDSPSNVARLFLRRPRLLDLVPIGFFAGAFVTGGLGIFDVGPNADYYAFIAAPLLTGLGWLSASGTEFISATIKECERLEEIIAIRNQKSADQLDSSKE